MKEIAQKISKKLIFLIFSILMIALNLTLITLFDYEEAGKQLNDFMYKLNIIPSIILMIILLFVNTDKFKIENIFLIFGLVIGGLYIAVIPIGGIPDENMHWYKSYEVSLGHFISDKDEDNHGGRTMDKNLIYVLTNDNESAHRVNEPDFTIDSYEDWQKRYKENINKEDGEEFFEFSNTAIYPAVCYIPQALGIAVSRIFSDSLMVQAYCARVGNLLAYIAIMWYAIKNVPFKKMVILVASFLPITFQEITSMSIDGLLIATSTLLISYTLYLTFDEKNKNEKLKIKDYCILILTGIFTAITKVVYLPLCLIIYIIPKTKFKDVKQKYIVLTLILVLITILDLFVVINSMGYENKIADPKADTFEQIKEIIKDPIGFSKVIVATANNFAESHTYEIFGNSLSWMDVNISPIYLVTLLVLTLYFVFSNNQDIEEQDENDEVKDVAIINKNKYIMKYFILGIVLISIFAIVFTEYVTINKVGNQVILGIQGRYYIPIIILLSFANNVIFMKQNKKIEKKYLYMILLFANLNALSCIMYKYL